MKSKRLFILWHNSVLNWNKPYSSFEFILWYIRFDMLTKIKMIPMTKTASTALIHVYISINYLTSCASEFHWVITLHKTLLHMLPFNFTEHPLVLLTLEKIKGNTSVTRVLSGTIIKIHLKKSTSPLSGSKTVAYFSASQRNYIHIKRKTFSKIFAFRLVYCLLF